MGQAALLNLAAFALQVCVIAGAATLLLAVLRIASPGARYTCWRVVLAACLLLPPLLQRPAVVEPVVEPSTRPGEGTVRDRAVSSPRAIASSPASPQAQEPLPWATLAAIVIGAGAAARGAWLAIGLVRLSVLRRRGVRVNDDEYADIQQTLGTHASLLSVEGLHQPATFGLWRPVVLLPEGLAESPASLRRAVVTHELFHVQRRDWQWVLAEEALRTVVWFHPAITWLISRIQLTREELVDELTVLATGNRKAYIEALLAFADAGRARPAPAFARRQHLFTRILRLSKERTMSSPRIVVSTATVIGAVLATGWYASAAFPIVSAAPGDAPTAAQRAAPPSTTDQPRVLLPRYQMDRLVAMVAGQVGPATSAPRQDVAVPVAGPQGTLSGGAARPGPAPAQAPPSGTKPITPENPIPRRLSSVPVPYPAQLRGSGFRANLTVRVTLDASGAISDVRQTSVEIGGDAATGADARARAIDAFVAGAAEAIRQWRYQPPAEPPIAFFVSVAFAEEADGVTVQSDSPAVQGRLVRFAASPSQYVAVADLERDLAEMKTRLADLSQRLASGHPDLQRLEERITEVERRRNLELQLQSAEARVVGLGATTGQPVRVGGNIRPPTKTKHVSPEYPDSARTARVQGVVILEVIIDEQGRVANARVLRSIPLLDVAALDAVRQWEFSPTLLNGSPVPVIMTVTVQFTLADQSRGDAQ